MTYENLYCDKVAEFENARFIKLIVQHVWGGVNGARQYTFEGHEAPVYFVCLDYKKKTFRYEFFVVIIIFLYN